MNFGNYYGGYQPWGGQAAPDMLNQYKGPYQQQAQQSGLVWVQGEAGAKSFLVGPGQSVLLMDSEAARFYLKSADTSGMPQPLRIFEYSEVNAAKPAGMDMGQFVTRAELDERLNALLGKSEVKENADNE